MVLRRNKLGEGFAKQIASTLFSDNYLKMIDVSGNCISEHSLSTIVKKGLLENSTLLCFDARINPGFTEKIQHQFALVTLKNIERMRAKGVGIKKDWIVPELYSYRVPPAILKTLALRAPGERVSRRTARTGGSKRELPVPLT